MDEIVLLTVSGPDKPGVTHSITTILSREDVFILDVGQAVIHATLSLGFLLGFARKEASSDVLREVLFAMHSQGLRVDFTPVTWDSYQEWIAAQGKQRHIITLISEHIMPAHVARISKLLAQQGLNIDKISRLSGRSSMNPKILGDTACLEFSVRGTPHDVKAMRNEIMGMSVEMGVDVAYQADDIFRRHRRMIVFDMDSTLIQCEVIDELAKAAGVGEQVAAITDAAMRGELDFNQSFSQRLSLLQGLEESKVYEIADRLPLTKGTERLCYSLKSLGYSMAIISGGFSFFANRLKDRLGFDHVFANTLEIEQGVVTGRVVGEIVDGRKKAEYLEMLAKQKGLSLKQVIAVGDGANDLPMLAKAGLGIAFNAKPIVKENARQALSTVGLDAILYLIGIKDRELVG